MNLATLLLVLAFLLFAGVSYTVWNKRKATPALLLMAGFAGSLLGLLISLISYKAINTGMHICAIGTAIAAVGFFLMNRDCVIEALTSKASSSESDSSEEPFHTPMTFGPTNRILPDLAMLTTSS